MNYISILIVDDDLKKIESIIKTIREVFTETLSIQQASCVQEAIETLKIKEFHLLITDLQMPLKNGDAPDNNGGESLIRALYKRKNNVNVPIYIVGLTQFEDLKNKFAGIWKIWHFDASLESWKINLRDLIFHISLINPRLNAEKIETIFVEGITDKKILNTCIEFYFSNYKDKVFIDTIKYGAGVSWVERQLFIWAKSLSIKEDDYLKAIGIFDDDDAGNKGIKRIREQIDLNSAEARTFSIIKNNYKYSIILKSIKMKGITFPTTVEDLISIESWIDACNKGWLVDRNTMHINIDSSLLALKVADLSVELLKENNFTDNEILLITKRISDEYKVDFCNMVCENYKEGLESIKFLMIDAFEKLKIKVEM